MNKQTCGAWVCGVATGVAFGLLFAPRKGSELRQNIKDSARDKANKLQNQASGILDASSAALTEVRDAGNQTRQRVQDAVDAGKEAYREVVG